MPKRDVLKRQQTRQQQQMQCRKLTAICVHTLHASKQCPKRDVLERHQTSQQALVQRSVDMDLRHAEAAA